MDVCLLSRIQFAVTVGFHFLFPPISIGLAWLLVVVEYLAWRRGDAVYERVGRLFGGLLGLTFAVGVATGIVMEFQFGTNWARYSKFVGDIFGAPLAAEGVLAFFLESTFLGVYLFARERLSRRAHWFSILMVAVGATLSALTMHGAVFLAHKSEGPMHERLARWTPALWAIFLALFLATTAATCAVSPFLMTGALRSPAAWALAALTLISLAGVPILVRRKRFGAALLASSAAIGAMIGLAAAGLFPRLVPSSTDLANSLTALNSSSTQGTLQAMLIIALVGMPVVLAYTVYVHWIFRGKVAATGEGY